MATSKTELAYVTGVSEVDDYTKPMNPSPYINVLRLYKRQIVRVPNPFIQYQLIETTNPLNLFINTDLLYIAQEKKLFGARLDPLFKD